MSAPAAGGGDAVREGLFESVLEVMPEIVLIHDEKTILFANAACRRFLAANCREDLEGRPLDILVHPDAYDAGIERRRLLLDGGRVLRDVPLKIVDLDGRAKRVMADAHPLSFGGVKAAMVVARPNGYETR